MKRINVTKTFLPPKLEYQAYVDQIWETDQLTNQGPLLRKFESEMRSYIGVENFHFVSNGTLALQLTLESLGADEGEIITTPFSYVATTSAILWQKLKPVYVDIEAETLGMDASKIEAAITPQTKAILPVHVFGIPCNVEEIERIAKVHNLPVIYDAAHAFGVEYKGRQLLEYGDMSVCSFHSTKLFHTIEGGCVIVKDTQTNNHIELSKRFGHNGDEHMELGMNAKASEFQAAMGLANLPYVALNIEKRKALTELYDKHLGERVQRPKYSTDAKHNYGYYPVIFGSEEIMLEIFGRLNQNGIFPRRYFYPSLNKLPYLDDKQDCPVSEDIASRIACLPLYPDLETSVVERICEIINS